MKIDFKHYIITMFNLNLKWDDKKTKIDEEYLKNRFSIFEKFTIASMDNQINKNFNWLVLFSSSTPNKYKNKIKEYKEKYKYFTPIYINDADAKDFKNIIRKYIKNNRKNNEIIVTTRCDNDDVINKKFVDNIQKNIKNENYVITYTKGYQYDTKKKIISKYIFPNNHFTTYVSTDCKKTIFDFLHMEIYNNNKVVELSNKPMWIEIIHESNIYNCMGTVKLSNYFVKEQMKENFGIDIEYKKNILYIIIIYFYYIIHKLYVKRKKIIKRIKDIIELKKARKSK